MTQEMFEMKLQEAVRNHDMETFNRLCDQYPECLKTFNERMAAKSEEVLLPPDDLDAAWEAFKKRMKIE